MPRCQWTSIEKDKERLFLRVTLYSRNWQTCGPIFFHFLMCGWSRKIFYCEARTMCRSMHMKYCKPIRDFIIKVMKTEFLHRWLWAIWSEVFQGVRSSRTDMLSVQSFEFQITTMEPGLAWNKPHGFMRFHLAVPIKCYDFERLLFVLGCTVQQLLMKWITMMKLVLLVFAELQRRDCKNNG